MQVQDIMVKKVKTCRLDNTLDRAIHVMWSNDCGALPVLDGAGKVAGMITDRDVCIAIGTRNRLPSEIRVFEVKPNPQELFTCAPQDDIHTALDTMRTRQVRRLPAVSQNGMLQGILCLNDVALNAKKRNALSYDDVVETLRAVCRQPERKQAAPEELPEEVPVLCD